MVEEYQRNSSVSIHDPDIQIMAAETFKVSKGLPLCQIYAIFKRRIFLSLQSKKHLPFLMIACKIKISLDSQYIFFIYVNLGDTTE